jgi:hypothetical protein
VGADSEVLGNLLFCSSSQATLEGEFDSFVASRRGLAETFDLNLFAVE